MVARHRRTFMLATLLAGVGLSTALMVGCSSSKSWDLSDVKHWYEAQPENWDECMDFARKATFNNEPDKAVEIYKLAMEMAKTDAGKDDMRVAQSAAALASLQQLRGAYQDAEMYYKKAIPIFESNVGSSNPIVIENKRYLVEVLNKQGKCDEAKQLEKQLPRVVTKTKKTSGQSRRKQSRKRRK